MSGDAKQRGNHENHAVQIRVIREIRGHFLVFPIGNSWPSEPSKAFVQPEPGKALAVMGEV
jgi:hypothetical protein